MSKKGGKRKGAGRKPMKASTKRKAKNVQFSPEAYSFLRTVSNASRFVDQLVLDSTEFAAWASGKAKKKKGS
jgi:hypothetical protein